MSEAKKINKYRDRLDQIDSELLKQMAKRFSVIREVASLKSKGADSVRDLVREYDLIKTLKNSANKLGLDRHLVEDVFRRLIEQSVRLQEEVIQKRGKVDIAVGYQGTDGAYSYLAAQRFFDTYKGAKELVGFNSFRELLQAVSDGIVKYAVLPLENTTAGTISEANDLLAEMNLYIIGEELQPVHHCLIGVEEVPLSRIRRILSHPQALMQCSKFISSLRGCEAYAYTDTAMAVQKIKDGQDLSQAAIASEEAAEFNGLKILRRDITDAGSNLTRMAIVAKEPNVYDERLSCKTSIVFKAKHEHGALLQVLKIFNEADLNLTKLESRPQKGKPWEYVFYVDFEGNLVSEKVKNAMLEVKDKTSWLKVLGSYPARAFDKKRPV